MVMYTVEQIRKAKRFRLTNNEHFDSDTEVGKWYELKNVYGFVCHKDEAGYDCRHVYRGGMDECVELSIRDGYIEYDISTSKQEIIEKLKKLEEGDVLEAVKSDHHFTMGSLYVIEKDGHGDLFITSDIGGYFYVNIGIDYERKAFKEIQAGILSFFDKNNLPELFMESFVCNTGGEFHMTISGNMAGLPIIRDTIDRIEKREKLLRLLQERAELDRKIDVLRAEG
ncbi:hypothetical protein [Bacillus chungangensis]|uniref:Phage protein n=1 Tax=Bacillus chungangensis TaxID=587633 RepID=A0ABT9WML6_9BACI|nr:hypothetical protein [Bacillus chungangensis]MDQ0174425.1 hypothetical protein [Bacillus chungangensis]